MSNWAVVRGAFGIVENQDMILLVKRRNPPYKDHWSLPGGHIEEGEEPETAVLRELEEETALKAVLKKFFGEYGMNHSGKHYHLICFELKIIGDNTTIREGSDALQGKWFLEKDIPWKDTAPIIAAILKDFLNMKEV